uniref:Uncharacterized protein n=1 Tax=Anguilla anguilla TaxID=7936 RepID=A0A0E9TL21_ANGAN
MWQTCPVFSARSTKHFTLHGTQIKLYLFSSGGVLSRVRLQALPFQYLLFKF